MHKKDAEYEANQLNINWNPYCPLIKRRCMTNCVFFSPAKAYVITEVDPYDLKVKETKEWNSSKPVCRKK